MTTLPTVDSLQQLAQAAIQSRRPELTDFNPGSVLDAVTFAPAILTQELQAYAVTQFDRLFFATDDIEALKTLVLDRFGGNLLPQEATAAVGSVTVSRAEGGSAVLIPAGTQIASSADASLIFETQTDQLLSDLTVDVMVQCLTTGPAGNVDVGQLTVLLGTPPADGLSVSNTERCAGGNSAETATQLRARVQTYYQNLSRAVKPALQLAALGIEGVRVAVVDEAHIGPDEGGYVELRIGDEEGYSNQTMIDGVLAILSDWRAAGVVVHVTGVSRLELGAELTLTLTSEAALGQVADSVQAALEAYGATLQAGQTIYLSQLERVAINVSPVDRGGVIHDCNASVTINGVMQEGDVSIEATQVPRIIRSLVTVSGVAYE